MADFRICLLHEYHRNQLILDQRYECLIFGSLLDRDSFELAYQIQKVAHPSILLIIFPVSKQWKATQYYFTQFQKILGQEHTSTSLSHIMIRFQNQIMKYIIRAFPASPDVIVDGVTPEEREYRKNIQIFGVIAAKYLRKMIHFPTVRIQNQWYNGIPRNFTVQSFISNIITCNTNSTTIPTNQNPKSPI